MANLNWAGNLHIDAQSILCFLWLLMIFMAFCGFLAFRVAFWTLCVIEAFCVVLYFITYGKKFESEKL